MRPVILSRPANTALGLVIFWAGGGIGVSSGGRGAAGGAGVMAAVGGTGAAPRGPRGPAGPGGPVGGVGPDGSAVTAVLPWRCDAGGAPSAGSSSLWMRPGGPGGNRGWAGATCVGGGGWAGRAGTLPGGRGGSNPPNCAM